jgi:ligand-binding SRPBCC domain-containing protein
MDVPRQHDDDLFCRCDSVGFRNDHHSRYFITNRISNLLRVHRLSYVDRALKTNEASFYISLDEFVVDSIQDHRPFYNWYYMSITTIRLETRIQAPIKICYDLSRSIDLHMKSTSFSKEKAIEGKLTGLIEANEFVTWQAYHFGLRLKMKVRITEALKPFFFHDQMVEGPFVSMNHAHILQQDNGVTVMRDEFQYEVPFGWFGRVFDRVILKKYMTRLLLHRNKVIRQTAENGEWKQYLNHAI